MAYAPDTAQKVAFLSSPASYAERPARVERIETHLAWVFLTERHAYKLKKPVHYPFLDFSTVAARRIDGLEEVRLNRRLAPGVYLDVVPLCMRGDRELVLDGCGEAVDWLVRMRRLPAERMLDVMIGHGGIPRHDLKRLVEVLVGFYEDLPSECVSGAAYRSRFVDATAENAAALRPPRYGLDATRIERMLRLQHLFLEGHADVLESRCASVVEGHGDLRPEHVCFERRPVIFDCLEFNRDFRLLDPVEELAFLSLECAALGAEEVGDALLEMYFDRTGDHVPAELIAFYKSGRAALRAKLCAWHIDDPAVRNPQAWLARARRYIELAVGTAQEATA